MQDANLGSKPSKALITIFAVATGALVANLYYAQPLVASIGPAIGVGPRLAGAIVSVTQIGYGIGLFLLVSLADLVENRKLVLVTLGFTTLGLVGAAVATAATPFFVAVFLVGLCSVGAQVLVPLAAHLVPEANRGRTVGNVMAGLLTGIMLARPLALFLAARFGWRSVFWISAAGMLVLGFALARMMPRYRPAGGMHYGHILRSTAGLFWTMPVVRRRAAYQALMFAAFNMFWTTVPILLARRFGMHQEGIALFALAGCGGALAAPLAGHLADRGFMRSLTAGAMLVLGIAFCCTRWAAADTALVALAGLAVLIDAAVQTNHIVSQRMIFMSPPTIRGRVNALYMTLLFLGGALGSVLGTFLYHWHGWRAIADAGGLIGGLMLLLFATERSCASPAMCPSQSD